MRRRPVSLLLYAVLMALAVFFLFPFYWVLASSLKSKAALTMIPPSFYPSKVETADLRVAAAGRIVAAADAQWLRLARSRDLLNPASTGQGGYCLKLEGGKPTQFVQWLPDADAAPVHPKAGEIDLPAAPVHRLRPSGREVVVAAKLARRREHGFTELLFVVPVAAAGRPAGEFEVLENPRHREVRVFSARWQNYPETLRGPEATFGVKTRSGFLLFMRNSFFIAFMAVLGQILSSSLVAYGFSRLRFRGNTLLFTLLLATLMVPAQVTLIPLFSIYKSLGWIDTFLPLIVPHFTAGAFNVFLLRQYMITLPRELDEAAAIDGCGYWGTYWHVVLPNCTAALIVVGLFTFVYAWQDIMGPLIYLDNPNYRTVTLGLEYFRSPYVDNRPLLMTGAVLAMLPVALIFLILQRFIMSGIATTGVKG